MKAENDRLKQLNIKTEQSFTKQQADIENLNKHIKDLQLKIASNEMDQEAECEALRIYQTQVIELQKEIFARDAEIERLMGLRESKGSLNDAGE